MSIDNINEVKGVNGGGEQIPADMIDPITLELMEDPVVAADGHSYSRASISEWFKRNNKSPLTNQSLPNRLLRPNHALRKLIDEYKENKARLDVEKAQKAEDEAKKARDALATQQTLARAILGCAEAIQQALRGQSPQRGGNRWDAQAPATYTSTVLRNLRKKTLNQLLLDPHQQEAQAFPIFLVPVVQRYIQTHPELNDTIQADSNYARTLEHSLYEENGLRALRDQVNALPQAPGAAGVFGAAPPAPAHGVGVAAGSAPAPAPALPQ